MRLGKKLEKNCSFSFTEYFPSLDISERNKLSASVGLNEISVVMVCSVCSSTPVLQMDEVDPVPYCVQYVFVGETNLFGDIIDAGIQLFPMGMRFLQLC